MKEIHLKYKRETGNSISPSYPSAVKMFHFDELIEYPFDMPIGDIKEQLHVYDAIYREQFPEIIYSIEYVKWLEEENERLQKQLNPYLRIVNK